eukprot:1918553-Rhodomonas_salina.2
MLTVGSVDGVREVVLGLRVFVVVRQLHVVFMSCFSAARMPSYGRCDRARQKSRRSCASGACSPRAYTRRSASTSPPSPP